MAARRLPPDYHITQRRKEEQQRNTFTALVEAEQKDRHFADWVNTTHDKIQSRRKLQVVDQFHQMHQKTIEERRERLAALLIEEQEEYFRALDNMVETQDQRKQRLASCAMELKQQREARRKELAQTKLDQAFRENCDVLREATSKVNTLQVVAGRAIQLKWAEAKKHELAEEDRIFDEMWEQERLKKVQRARDDMERTHRMNLQLREHLDAQKAAYDMVKAREKELQDEEDRIYREQIQHELQLEAQREKERMEEAHARGKATKAFNEKLRAEKAEQERLNRLADLKELEVILAKIKEDDERDLQHKMERQQEMQRYQEALREHIRQEAQNEAEIEKLWQQETEKAWEKREEGWRREQEARERLLKDVMLERSKQLAQKYDSLKERKKEQAAEKERLLHEMEKAAQVEAEKAQEKREFMAQARADLERQIEERSYFKGNSQREVDIERVSNALAEEEYRKRVQRELEAVEAKKPPQFRAMRTITRPI
eukprot:GGOE01000862.1.p1 GENE.GGOE01000862.1~~GGOE01000862.1.p1  ORF type:complete len:488 (-),score=221.71 GGOE01000862.1:263-1726(-)